jgi:2-polyprenyl-6-methoxyphenol hydroxylase-like FAD-dependent oxidoreductase
VAPVLIAGAGPTGLTLACDLSRRGIPCRVVDKAKRLFVGSRAKGLQPRTLEVFDDLGLIDAVLAAGAPFPSFRGYAGQRVIWDRSLHDMFGIPPPTPRADVPYPAAWLLPQWRTDELLRDRLLELGGILDLATELVGFEQDGAGGVATLRREGRDEQARFSYLVGADGGHSFVRKALGVSFAGETFEKERTLIGDVEVDGPLDHEHCHILSATGDVSNPNRFSLWGLPQTDRFQFVVNLAPTDHPDLSLKGLQQMLEQRSGRTDLRLHHLSWVSLYRVNVRMVDRFRVDRVFLAGDAAHAHSSAGGQGLNTSVQDAYNLAWKLAAVLRGAPANLLDTYEAERMPLAADLLGLTTKWHRSEFQPPPAPSLSDSASAPAPALPALPEIYQLGLHYRGGPLSVEARTDSGRVRAGDRAPDATHLKIRAGTTLRLFDLLRGPHFTLLAFGRDAPDLHPRYASSVHAWSVLPSVDSELPAGVLSDSRAELRTAFDLHDTPALVLIRPDGYIGLIADPDRQDVLEPYLARTLPPLDGGGALVSP